ncbi:MAG: type II secretion system F family protein [Defluviitaleaceae bacterium]|nr:type II secretion system F family protein [Defluviitaleaceae bacterium]
MAISPKRANDAGRIKMTRAFWHIDIFDLLSGKGISAGRKVSLHDLAVFCREAAFLLDAGLPIKEALLVLAEQTTSRALSGVVSDVHSLIMQGESFSHALRVTGIFPTFMCGYIAIGERTANLPGVCLSLADYFESRAATQEELTSVMIYPIIVSVMMFGVIAMAVTFVLPGYSRIFAASDVSLPAATSALLSFSDFISENAFTVLGIIFASFFALTIFFRTNKGKNISAFLKLKIPFWRQNINCNITQGLSLLLSSGLSISEAIPICGEITDNLVVKKDLEKLSASVNSGVAFWVALREISYINPHLISLSRVGENTGSLSQTIEKCNIYLEDAYKREIRRLNKFLAPLLILVIGIILAAVMLAIILPTFELATAI